MTRGWPVAKPKWPCRWPSVTDLMATSQHVRTAEQLPGLAEASAACIYTQMSNGSLDTGACACTSCRCSGPRFAVHVWTATSQPEAHSMELLVPARRSSSNRFKQFCCLPALSPDGLTLPSHCYKLQVARAVELQFGLRYPPSDSQASLLASTISSNAVSATFACGPTAIPMVLVSIQSP